MESIECMAVLDAAKIFHGEKKEGTGLRIDTWLTQLVAILASHLKKNETRHHGKN